MRLRPIVCLLVAVGCARSFDQPAAVAVDRARMPIDGARVWTDATDDPIRRQQPGARAAHPIIPPVIQEGHLSNGVRVLLVARHALPIVTFGVVVSRGTVDAPPGQFGLMFSSMADGSRSSSKDDFWGYLHAFGVETQATTSREYSLFWMRTLPSLAVGPARLNGEACAEPKFDSEDFDNLKTDDLDALVYGDDAPTQLTDLAARARAYPMGHPYRVTKAGTVDGLKALTLDGAKRVHAAGVQKDDVTVIAAGDIEMSRLINLYEGTLGKMTGTAAPRIKAPPASPPSRALVVLDQKALRQDAISVRFLGVPFTDPDYPALLVAARSLRDTLHDATRLERGSTYGIGANLWPQLGPAMVELDWRTDPSGTGRALEDLLKAIARLRSTALTAESVQSQIRSAPGIGVDAVDTNEDTMGSLATVAGLDLSVEQWNRLVARLQVVTPQMVLSAAQRYLDLEHMVLVVAGDAARLGPTLQNLALGAPEIQ